MTAPTRDEILEIAVGLFAARGYHGVSMDDIGSAVGVTGGVTEPAGKTRPWWAKPAEQPMVPRRPRHDHRFGPCTPAGPRRRRHRTARGCHWAVTTLTADTVHNGCRECTGHYFRRADRRRSRHDSRRELRDPGRFPG